jgi:hypothetical protein
MVAVFPISCHFPANFGVLAQDIMKKSRMVGNKKKKGDLNLSFFIGHFLPHELLILVCQFPPIQY